MIPIAHFIAISCYIGAAALAALPFARRVRAPVGSVIGLLVLGAAVHAVGLAQLTLQTGSVSVTGLGPALSFAGFVLAVALIVVESFAREVTLTLAAAPLAALMTDRRKCHRPATLCGPGRGPGLLAGSAHRSQLRRNRRLCHRRRPRARCTWLRTGS